MLFDEAPKTSLQDFFNFRSELEASQDALAMGSRLVVVTGLRRMGKTSLVLTALNEGKVPYVLIDGRIFVAAPTISRAEFIQAFERALNSCVKQCEAWWKRIARFFKQVRGVEVEAGAPPIIRLTWGERPAEAADLVSLLEKLGQLSTEDKKQFVLVLDEAQEFRRLAGFDLGKLLAYIYDHVRTVQLIITGSQVGFLQRFLGVEDARSPLFGRHYVEVRLHHLAPEEARTYLDQGFTQLGWKPDPRLLEEAVASLNGIIGWLTYLGAVARKKGKLSYDDLSRTMSSAARLAAEELNNYLAYRTEARVRYLLILRHIATSGPSRWSELKRAVEAEQGRKLSPTVFTQLLNNLVNSGFVQHQDEIYEISDSVLIRALKEGLIA